MIIEIGGFTRPMLGERYNGDSIYIHQDDDLAVCSVIDGIGHGRIAHQISQKISKYLPTVISEDPAEMIARTHEFMKGSEGAALGIGVVRNKIFTFASMGNISCFLRGKKTKRFVSSEGLLGVRGRTAKKESVALSAGDVVVMHSDGLSLQNMLSGPPVFHLFSAKGLARKMINEHGSSYDDASVIVMQVKK
jgi:serine/threonine protein phosphatase PrpC